jgi:enoyl-CoA hydratase/isomerase-like protein
MSQTCVAGPLLWGGIGAGVLFLALLLTHGFGLFSRSGEGAGETPLLVRQGDKIIVPEGSALRSLRLAHRIGTAKASEMMLTCRSYTGAQAEAMHLANFCFPDDRFEAELATLTAQILANSWYSNQVNKLALIEIDGLSLRNAHRLDLFKNEGLAPDAAKRLSAFFKDQEP